MDKNKLIAISVVILAAIFGAYYLMNNNGPKNPNFAVYINEKYGFSIEYPKVWEVKEDKGGNTVAEFFIGAQPQLAIFAIQPARSVNNAEDLKNYIGSLDPNKKYFQGEIQKINNTDVVIIREPKIETDYHLAVPLNQNAYLEIAGKFSQVYQEIFASFRLR